MHLPHPPPPPSQIVLVPVTEIYIKMCFCSCIRLFSATHYSWCCVFWLLTSHLAAVLQMLPATESAAGWSLTPNFQAPLPKPALLSPPAQARCCRVPATLGARSYPLPTPPGEAASAVTRDSLSTFPCLKELISAPAMEFLSSSIQVRRLRQRGVVQTSVEERADTL